MRSVEMGQTVVRRDVHRTGRVWSKQALRVVEDTDEALVGPAPYAMARTDGDRSVRTEAFDAMVTGAWELAAAVPGDYASSRPGRGPGPGAPRP